MTELGDIPARDELTVQSEHWPTRIRPQYEGLFREIDTYLGFVAIARGEHVQDEVVIHEAA